MLVDSESPVEFILHFIFFTFELQAHLLLKFSLSWLNLFIKSIFIKFFESRLLWRDWLEIGCPELIWGKVSRILSILVVIAILFIGWALLWSNVGFRSGEGSHLGLHRFSLGNFVLYNLRRLFLLSTKGWVLPLFTWALSTDRCSFVVIAAFHGPFLGWWGFLLLWRGKRSCLKTLGNFILSGLLIHLLLHLFIPIIEISLFSLA